MECLHSSFPNLYPHRCFARVPDRWCHSRHTVDAADRPPDILDSFWSDESSHPIHRGAGAPLPDPCQKQYKGWSCVPFSPSEIAQREKSPRAGKEMLERIICMFM